MTSQQRDRQRVPAEQAGKVPPSDFQAEQAVLGSILLDPTAYAVVKPFVSPSSFYWEKHAAIFSVMGDLFAENQPTDLVTVAARLKAQDRLDAAGGDFYLMDLSEAVPFPRNADYYARIVQEKATLRFISVEMEEMGSRVYEPDADPRKIAQHLVEKALEFTVGHTARTRTLNDILPTTLEQIGAAIRDDPSAGPLIMRRGLDPLVGRFVAGEMTLVGGPSGGGKTALMVTDQVMRWAMAGVRCFVTSAEMFGEQNAIRWLSWWAHMKHNADVPYMSLSVGGKKAEQNMRLIEQVAADIGRLPVHVLDDRAGDALDVATIRAEMTRIRAQHPKEQFAGFVDYAQLIDPGDEKSNETRERQVSKISRGIKRIGARLECPMITMTQLNSDWRGRDANGEPHGEHAVRESRALYHDAGRVIYIYPFFEQQMINGKEVLVEHPSRIWFKKDKGRDGATFKRVLNFRKPYAVFLTDEEAADSPQWVTSGEAA